MNLTALFLRDPRLWSFLELTGKATLILLLSAVAALGFRLASAALRHRIWVSTFFALLLLAVVSAPPIRAIVPGWQCAIIPASPMPAADDLAMGRDAARLPRALSERDDFDIVEASRTARLRFAAESEAMSADRNSAPRLERSSGENKAVGKTSVIPLVRADDRGKEREPLDGTAFVSAMNGIALIWLGGALLMSTPLVLGLVGNARFRRRGQTLTGSEWQRLAIQLSDRIGLKRRVTLLRGEPQQMPMTFGVWRAYVMLPPDANTWSAARREIVLLHELAHVKRFDTGLQIVARLACAVYWFHPMAWWGLGRMRSEREHACDDAVLRSGQKASDYAAELLEIAREHCGWSPFAAAAVSMARRSQLEGRLLSVLDDRRRRSPVGMAWMGGLTAATLALVLILGIVRPALRAQTALVASNTAVVAPPTANRDSKNEMVFSGRVRSPSGKPASGALIEAIAFDDGIDWHRTRPGNAGFDRFETKADDSGKFKLTIPHSVSNSRGHMNLYASDGEHHVAVANVDPRLDQKRLDLKFSDLTRVQLRVMDTAGMPLEGVEPHLRNAVLVGNAFLGTYGHQFSSIAGWPHFSRSDSQGVTSVSLPASVKDFSVYINDDRVSANSLNLKMSAEPIAIALKPARFLIGKVTDAESGKPVAGLEVVVMEEPPRSVRTDGSGGFRVVSGSTIQTLFPRGESIIHFYPPVQSDYLFHAIEWKWPGDGFSNGELSVALKRGIVVEGQVLERGTGKPLPGATLFFQPQEKHNRYFTETSRSRFAGSDMKYATDANGHFRLPVWPGPGYLMVVAPTLDYIHTETSMGDRYYGKPGLQREYFDAAVKLNLKPDDHPAPIKIELTRGVTLRRKVMRPDGQPAKGKLYARSYLKFKNDINQYLPDVPIENGRVELPGFDAERSNPLFLIDVEGHCAAAVSPAVTSISGSGVGRSAGLVGSITLLEEDIDAAPPIHLQRCGSANFRFVDEHGKALANYTPTLMLMVTPGAVATHHIEPNRPLWRDDIIWQNVVRTAEVAKADTDGRITISDLIPGATYRLSYVNKKGLWDEGYEFTPRSGETIDVGKVVLPQHD